MPQDVLLMSTLQASMPVNPTVGGPMEIEQHRQDAEKALSSLPCAVDAVDLGEVRRRHAQLQRGQDQLLGLVRQGRYDEGRALIETTLTPRVLAHATPSTAPPGPSELAPSGRSGRCSAASSPWR